ncbi:MAG: site-2 protease family protein [Candidatus Berkelbacteria bacterium]|nr:site-2 protease family protein [Candidatus Berkelbacteria bacterium]
MILTILVFLLILTVLVLIHELGHFLVAKKLGIKVEEFGFGIPPRAFGIKKGETLFSINWLPFGGFVKLYGEDEAGAGRVRSKKSEVRSEINRAFFARPIGQRAAVCIAGVVMNAILAVVIFYAFLSISNFKTELPLLGEHKFFLVNQKDVSDIIISSVSKNSPAEKAGIKPLSKIMSVNGEKIISPDQFVFLINKNKGKNLLIMGKNVKTNQEFNINVIPRISPPKGEGALGVAFFPIKTAVLSYDNLPQKVFSGFTYPANLLVYNFDVISKLFAVSVKEKSAAPLSEGVSGPVGIYSLVGSIVSIPDAKERILQILNLAGILSISLAFFNILPIPALDGGRLFFIAVEAVTKKKVNPKFESYAHAIGMAILLILIVLITVKDIGRIFNP